MSKKGWKCWAKWLTSVASPANDGYAFEGEFTEVGATVEAHVGDVLLHVDQSSSADVFVCMQNQKGAGFRFLIASAGSDGRKWCGPLAGPARRLLDMSVEARIAHVAGLILDKTGRPEPLNTAAIKYWSALAGREIPVAAEPQSSPAEIDRDSLIAERLVLVTRLAEIDALIG